MKDKQAFIFLGASGSGKGTQAKLLIDYLKSNDKRNVAYVEMGHRFRGYKNSKKYLGKKIYKTISDGELLPVFLAIWNWTESLFNEVDEDSHIVFDGTPRQPEEPDMLEGAFDFMGYENVHIIYLEVNKEELIKRMSLRGRHDDEEEKLKKRLLWFDKNIFPMIQNYEKNKRYHFHKISGLSDIDEIHKEIVSRVINR
jgi:adenylate kinase